MHCYSNTAVRKTHNLMHMALHARIYRTTHTSAMERSIDLSVCMNVSLYAVRESISGYTYRYLNILVQAPKCIEEKGNTNRKGWRDTPVRHNSGII